MDVTPVGFAVYSRGDFVRKDTFSEQLSSLFSLAPHKF
jgi:hypothetical protein